MSLSSVRTAAGTVAGLLATVPMTALMVAWHRRLPWRSQQPLPPAQITGQMLRGVGLEDDLSSKQQQTTTVANHLAYGAAAGGLYGCLFVPHSAASAAATGVAYGLGVWGASYLGWLPALGLHHGAAKEPSGRNAMMIAAHVAWGGSLGLLSHAVLMAMKRSRPRRSGPTHIDPEAGRASSASCSVTF